MAFFDTLKQNLMTTGQTTVDKAKTTVEILKSQRYFLLYPL